MSDRQEVTFTTPAGNIVVLKAYLNGRESAQVKAVEYSAVKMTMSDVQSKKFDPPSLSGSSIVDKELKEVELFVVSLNGETDKAFENLLDLPATEYDAVLKKVQEIKDPTKPENSAQPGSGISQTA